MYVCMYVCTYRRSGNFHVKNNSHEKFSRFRSIRKIFLTVDNCNTDEHLETCWRLVYYQVSGEPGIAGCSHRSDIYLRGVDLRASLFTDHHHVILFFACLIFAARNYFNSEIFTIYGMCIHTYIHTYIQARPQISTHHAYWIMCLIPETNIVSQQTKSKSRCHVTDCLTLQSSHSLVPMLSWDANMHRAESLVSFLCKHDVIKIGPEHKGNILCVVQPTMSSTLGVYVIQPPIARYMY